MARMKPTTAVGWSPVLLSRRLPITGTGERWGGTYRSKQSGAEPAPSHGGKDGIRTHGGVATSTVFETVPFVHSGTLPLGSIRVPWRRVQRERPTVQPRWSAQVRP